MPAEFISWVVQHLQDHPHVRIVVANYEADAQLAKLAVDRAIDEAQHPFAAAAAREAMDE